MAKRVFFHIGGAKTGTTYLQSLMWENRGRLRAHGVLIPGEKHGDRVKATMVIRGVPPQFPGEEKAWDQIVSQVRVFPGDAVISHEFFGTADPDQADRALADVQAEAHLVYTARDLTRVLPALWQERVKFVHAGSLDDYDPAPVTASARDNWSWRVIDASDALGRWGRNVPPERVHVVTVPKQPADRRELWRRFAAACGIDPDLALAEPATAYESVGLVEAELLRRLSGRLGPEFRKPRVAPRWVRSYLAHGVLSARKGERIGLDAQRYAEVRARGLAIVADLRARGYDVVGDLNDLVPDPTPPTVRGPSDVTAEELLDVSLDVIATMLGDMYRDEVAADGRSRADLEPGPESARPGRLRARIRRIVRA